MNFSIDPPSGYADSYLDIEFTVTLNPEVESVIHFTNNYSKENLYILSVSHGHIRDGNQIVTTGVSKLTGYLNLFNDDRMNQKLSGLPSVDITCHVSGESETLTFYNESMSLDSHVSPISVRLANEHSKDSMINLSLGPPSLIVTTDIEKKYELCLKSDDGLNSFTFEIVTKRGSLRVYMPEELISYHLRPTPERSYTLYYVKFEGFTAAKQMNRRYIPLQFKIFFSGQYELKPQTRLGPGGSILGKEFVLSDRYFVHTLKEFSSFGKKEINPVLATNYSRFAIEIAELKEQQNSFVPLRVSTVRQTIRQEELIKTAKVQRYTNPSGMQGAFLAQVSGTKTFTTASAERKPALKSEGCGCSRKSKQG